MNLFAGLKSNLIALFALAAVLLAPPVAAQLSALTEDGWHTWAVEAVESVPELCCYQRHSSRFVGGGCDLDRRRGFSTSSDRVGGDVQLYVRMEDGTVADLRALSASCPVTTETPITDLGRLPNDESVNWLTALASSGTDLVSEATVAIAVHAEPEARNWLLETARSGNDTDAREDAIFWMAQVRLQDSERELKRFIHDDDDPEIREHAAFSYAQSGADDIAEVLIRQGRNDEDADVRSQAWFWLAQTEAPESETAIARAMLEDDDDDVREEAVFALSQLPDDRAVAALASILENRDLDMDIREQALFWLAQVESDEALEYIDNILSDN